VEDLNYQEIIERRRALVIKPFRSLTDVGFDGPWVTPYQMFSKSPDGPVLVALHWLEEETIRIQRPVLEKFGYLPDIRFNTVIDMALKRQGLKRSDIYVTQTFGANSRFSHPMLFRRDYSIRTSRKESHRTWRCCCSGMREAPDSACCGLSSESARMYQSAKRG
jgi:hypothetical protein